MRNSSSRGKPTTMSVSGFDQRPSGSSSRRRAALGPCCGCDEARKQRMRARRPRTQLGMELHPDEPGMILELHDLDQRAVGREATQLEPIRHELIAIAVRDFITMAVALADLG